MMTITTLFVLAFSTLTVRADAAQADAKIDATPINAFACDLYAQLRATDPNANLFFSPYSMSAALAMTAEGARGTTAKEMLVALHAGDDLATLHTALSDLSVRLGGKPVPPELREKIASLRADLEAANVKLSQNSSDWREMQKLHEKAEGIAAKLNALLAQVDQYELKSANALWGEQSFTFERTYLDAVARYYKTGGMFPVDFLRDPDGSRVRINDWVAKQTRDRIKDLIKPGLVRSDTRLVLTNAIYFFGEWSDPFEAKQTKDEDFTTSAKDGAKSRVKLMHKWNPEGARYAAFNGDGSAFNTPDKIARADENDEKKTYPDAGGFLVAELPYKGGDLSMVILLPRSGDGLAKLESKLSAANLATWTGALRERKMEMFLPKFRLETAYDMNGPLAAMGIKRAFVNPIEPNGADFSGISASSDPSKQLYIGAVVHKAFVEVNEKGTEAAAATAVIMGAGSAMPQMVPFAPTFRADHPFIFVIRERATGAILFIGRLSSPPPAAS